MANEEDVAKLKEGAEAWNAWRLQNTRERPDLSGASLCGISLVSTPPVASLVVSVGTGTSWEAIYKRANLTAANMAEASLQSGSLAWTDFSGADLSGSNLEGADLSRAVLSEVSLEGANLSGATFYRTTFGNTNLRNVRGLDSTKHTGPSYMDYGTISLSNGLPTTFLRGCGLQDNLIEYLPSLINKPIQFYKCFISYSSLDDEFTNRLHADLQNNGVRCWLATEDIKIGDKILDALDRAIRVHDKLLLVLSENSIASEWVEDEVTIGFAEERKRNEVVMIPIRLDDAVMETTEPWAAKLKNSRLIGDFRQWKEHDEYQKAFKRLLRDLKVEIAATSE